jgi:uncharacterized membrane protein YfcA
LNLSFFITLIALGGICGFSAGFIGLGGGILLFPLLLYVPPFLGLGSLDVKTIAALVISQVFFAGLVGGAAHWRSGRVHGRLTLVASVTSAASSFFGGVASRWVSEGFLLLLFAVVVFFAAAVMFLPGPPGDRDEIPGDQVIVPLPPLAILSCVTGAVVGFLGVLKVPTRIAIGSSLVIHVVNTFSGFLGKLLTGQIPYLMTIAVLVGAGLGALGGEWSHGRISPRTLRFVYAAVIGVVAAAIWIALLSQN